MEAAVVVRLGSHKALEALEDRAVVALEKLTIPAIWLMEQMV